VGGGDNADSLFVNRQWVPLEECRAKLDATPYCRLAPPPTISTTTTTGLVAEEEEEPIDLSRVRMDVGPFPLLSQRSQAILAPILTEYAALVGPQLAASMVLKFT